MIVDEVFHAASVLMAVMVLHMLMLAKTLPGLVLNPERRPHFTVLRFQWGPLLLMDHRYLLPPVDLWAEFC